MEEVNEGLDSHQDTVAGSHSLTNVVVVAPTDAKWAVSYYQGGTNQLTDWRSHLLDLDAWTTFDNAATPHKEDGAGHFRLTDLASNKLVSKENTGVPTSLAGVSALYSILSVIKAFLKTEAKPVQSQTWTLVFLLTEKKLHPRTEFLMHHVAESLGYEVFVLWPSLIYAVHWRISDFFTPFCCLVPIKCDNHRIEWDKSVLSQAGQVWKDDVYACGEKDIPAITGMKMVVAGSEPSLHGHYPLDYVVHNAPLLCAVLDAVDALRSRTITVHTEIYTDADFHYVDGVKTFFCESPTPFKLSGKYQSFVSPAGNFHFEFYDDGCLKSVTGDCEGETPLQCHPLCAIPPIEGGPTLETEKGVFAPLSTTLEELLLWRRADSSRTETSSISASRSMPSTSETIPEMISLESNDSKDLNRMNDNPEKACGEKKDAQHEQYRLDEGSLVEEPIQAMDLTKKRPPAIMRYWKKRLRKLQRATRTVCNSTYDILMPRRTLQDKKQCPS